MNTSDSLETTTITEHTKAHRRGGRINRAGRLSVRSMAVGLVLAVATVVAAASPASAAAFFNTPRMWCGPAQVSVNPAISDYPDYLRTTDAYWRAWLQVWNGSKFVNTNRYLEGRVWAGNASGSATFNVTPGYSYRVIVRRWNWDPSRGWVSMYSGSGTVAMETRGTLFTGNSWCSTRML